MICEFPSPANDFLAQLQFARSRIQALWIQRLASARPADLECDLPALRALAGRACDIVLHELQMPSRPMGRVAEGAVPPSLAAFFDVGRSAFREVALALVEDVMDARALASAVMGVSEAFERMRLRETATYVELLRGIPGAERAPSFAAAEDSPGAPVLDFLREGGRRVQATVSA